MTIKSKLRAGFAFLFLLAFVCCGLSIYYLNRLSADAGVILKDNYESLQYMRIIGNTLDQNEHSLTKAETDANESNLVKEEHNITEQGEQQAADSLRSKYEQLKLQGNDAAKQASLRREMRAVMSTIIQLNMIAIEHKNVHAHATASRATILVALIGSFLFLVAFTFIVNFPGYIANPIREL